MPGCEPDMCVVSEGETWKGVSVLSPPVASDDRQDLWVPKTYATWADVLRSEGGFRPVYVRRLEGRATGGMIFGLWA